MFHYHVELPGGKHLNNIPIIVDDWVCPRPPNAIHVRHIVLVEFLSSQADRLDVKPATSCWPWKKLNSKGPKEGVLLELGLTTLPFIKGKREVPDIRKFQWRDLGLCKAMCNTQSSRIILLWILTGSAPKKTRPHGTSGYHGRSSNRKYPERGRNSDIIFHPHQSNYPQ